MNTVFARTMFIIIITLLLFLAILWAVFITGIGLSFQRWQKNQDTFGEAAGGNRNRINKRLITSVNLTVVTGVILSFCFSFVFAFIFSKVLSRVVNTLVHGIEEIAAGNLTYKMKETGIKEFRLIAQSANALAMKLSEEQDLRTQWTNDITHDLRTPLAALRAQLEGMRDGILDTTPSRYHLLLAELGRIEELVNDFNELIKLESPGMSIHPEEIDIEVFLQELVQLFSLKASKKYITVKKKIICDNQKKIEFSGDKHLLLRAASNLVANAVQYADKGGTIELTVVYKHQTLYFSVFNTGKIIPVQEIPLVFNRFYRGEYARHTEGSGLGLAITKKIIELHNGTIHIESIEGKGTTVTIKFPQKKNK